jgi:hypothetical protein
MRETFQDIVRHTGGLGFIDTVKITGSDEETLVEAMDNERTVIVKGKLLNVEPALKGEFGLSQLGLLQGLVTSALFKGDEDTVKVEVKRRDRNGVQTPEEIVFSNKNTKSSAAYRLMSKDLIPDQAKFLGTQWDVEVDPSASKLKELQALAGLYSTFENFFMVKTVKNDEGNNELRFYIGDEGSSMHRAYLTIDDNVSGELGGDLHWGIAPVMAILKLGADENPKLQFSSRGALQITMASGQAEYKFILPARKK